MNIIGLTFSALVALLVIVVLGIGGYVAIDYIIALFSSMDIQVARVTAIASVVLLLAAMLIASSIRQASKLNMAAQFHTNKAATYRLFIRTWGGLLRRHSGTSKPNAVSLAEELQTLNRQLALFGSPAIIKIHTTLYTVVIEKGSQNSEVTQQFSKALLEMRKDIGSDMGELSQDDLRGLVLADFKPNEDSRTDLVSVSR